jgi:hypothetical protein
MSKFCFAQKAEDNSLVCEYLMTTGVQVANRQFFAGNDK